MIKIINKTKDGAKTQYIDKPFYNSKIYQYKFDNVLYAIAYDDLIELCRFIENNYNYESNYMIFKIENQKLIDVETIKAENHEKLNNYQNYFILFNGLISVSDFLKLIEE